MAEAKSRKTKTEPAADPEPQKVTDASEGQGFYGVAVDPTDNHAYTVAGVLAGEATPETDTEHAVAVRQHLDAVQGAVKR